MNLPGRNSCDLLTIAHMNCQSIRLCGEFKNVVEPHVFERFPNIAGFILVRNDRLHARGGGIGTYVSAVNTV